MGSPGGILKEISVWKTTEKGKGQNGGRGDRFRFRTILEEGSFDEREFIYFGQSPRFYHRNSFSVNSTRTRPHLRVPVSTTYHSGRYVRLAVLSLCRHPFISSYNTCRRPHLKNTHLLSSFYFDTSVFLYLFLPKKRISKKEADRSVII